MVRSRAADGQSCIIGDETRVIIAEGWPVSTRSSGQPDGGVFLTWHARRSLPCSQTVSP